MATNCTHTLTRTEGEAEPLQQGKAARAQHAGEGAGRGRGHAGGEPPCKKRRRPCSRLAGAERRMHARGRGSQGSARRAATILMPGSPAERAPVLRCLQGGCDLHEKVGAGWAALPGGGIGRGLPLPRCRARFGSAAAGPGWLCKRVALSLLPPPLLLLHARPPPLGGFTPPPPPPPPRPARPGGRGRNAGGLPAPDPADRSRRLDCACARELKGQGAAPGTAAGSSARQRATGGGAAPPLPRDRAEQAAWEPRPRDVPRDVWHGATVVLLRHPDGASCSMTSRLAMTSLPGE